MEISASKSTSNVLTSNSMLKKIFLFFVLIIFSTPSYTDDKMVLGLEVFNNKAQCGVCHTLNAAGSEGQIGPNLDQLKPQMEKIVYVVTNGIGVMPGFSDILSPEEIKAVAHYVFNSANK